MAVANQWHLSRTLSEFIERGGLNTSSYAYEYRFQQIIKINVNNRDQWIEQQTSALHFERSIPPLYNENETNADWIMRQK